MALRNQPYIPLYVQDFISDEKVRECSAESVGVYIFLMCVMHKSDEYGKIILTDKYFCSSKTQADPSMFAIMLANHLPFTHDVIERALTELIKEKVIYLDGNTLIQKRMVRDCKLSQTRALAGSKGGKKRVKNQANFAQAKTQARSEDEYEYETEDETVDEYEVENEDKEKENTIYVAENDDTNDPIPYSEIVNYLNEKTGKSYKSTTTKTREHIHARFQEGFNLDDFKMVIDKKVKEWGASERMKNYLRPDTLFNTKFEWYLNQDSDDLEF